MVNPKHQTVERIWYASYGSNLSFQRFMCYITGGRPTGSEKTNSGCRDKTPPLDNKPISLNLRLYFAGFSTSWQGAPAFIGTDKVSVTLGRMYLITDEQFNDVVLQENDKEVDGTRFVPPFQQLTQESEFELPGKRLYGHVLRVGKESNWPVITFTTSRKDMPIGSPSMAYIKIIISGIKETYPAMTNTQICEYLMRTEGIHNRIPTEHIIHWVEETV